MSTCDAECVAVGLIVPVWLLTGTYNPTLKLIFAEEHPMDPATLTAIRTAIAAAVMLVAIAAKPRDSAAEPSDNCPTNWSSDGRNGVNGASQQLLLQPASGSTPLGLNSSSPLPPSPAAHANAAPSPLESALTLALLGGVLAAGVELGLYLFVEVSTESVGLQLTSATRAGFLTQSTAVLTPILSYLAVRRQR